MIPAAGRIIDLTIPPAKLVGFVNYQPKGTDPILLRIENDNDPYFRK
jgi:hypothetical protein